jgi:hypothetical protein
MGSLTHAAETAPPEYPYMVMDGSGSIAVISIEFLTARIPSKVEYAKCGPAADGCQFFSKAVLLGFGSNYQMLLAALHHRES